MRRGLILALAAQMIWGFAALYWVQTEPVKPVDLVAHRALWSLLVLVLMLLFMGRLFSALRQLANPRTLAVIASSAAAQAANWGLFLWAVTNQRAAEASLGYFLLPLVNVAMGIVFFRETIDRAQWIAVVLASLGMALLVAENGGLPWVALGVALSFGLYGLIRKKVSIGAVDGLAMETALMCPMALAWLVLSDGGGLGQYGLWVDGFLLASGLMTAIPLLLYVAAAQRLPLTTMGLVFYLGPSCQLFVAICLFGESINAVQFSSFALVWLGLGVIGVDSLRRYRSVRALQHE